MILYFTKVISLSLVYCVNGPFKKKSSAHIFMSEMCHPSAVDSRGCGRESKQTVVLTVKLGQMRES